MVTMSKALSVAQAESYYTKSNEKSDTNYWEKDSTQSKFIGKNLNDFGINKNQIVDEKNFKNLIRSINPKTNEKIIKDGVTGKERAGFDIVFSVSKSMSIFNELTENKIIESVHQKSVDNALNYVQDNLVQTRVRSKDQKRIKVKTDNMIAAQFQHHTTRTKDPSLHIHNVIMNYTKFEDRYLSIEPQKIYESQKMLDQLVQNDNAHDLINNGFEISWQRNKGDLLEAHLVGIDEKIIQLFSKRQVEVENKFKELKEQFPERDEKELWYEAGQLSKLPKGKNTKEEVQELWKNELKENGFELKDISNVKIKKSENLTEVRDTPSKIIDSSIKYVTKSISVFSKEDILLDALKLSRGAHHSSLLINELEKKVKKIHELKNEYDLVKLDEYKYTSKEMIHIENNILNYAQINKNKFTQITNKYEADNYLSTYKIDGKYNLSDGQMYASKLLLTSKDAIIAIQGDAGTGKTTGVFKSVNDFIVKNKSNVELIGLAATAKAAHTIESESGIKSQTIDSFIYSENDENTHISDTKKIFIIDEASMLGSKKLNEIIEMTKNATIVMVGDSKQLSAIEQGSFFSRSIEHQLFDTAFMNESKRQKTQHTKEIIEAFKNHDIDKSFQLLKSYDRFITENKSTQLQDRLIDNYMNDVINNRNSAILVNSNKERKIFNERILENLIEMNKIDTKIHNITTLEQSRSNVGVNKYISQYYNIGDVIVNHKMMANQKPNTKMEILQVNHTSNKILVLPQNSDKPIWLNIARNAEGYTVYEKDTQSFSIGQKIIFDRNEKKLGINNGDIATIKKINGNIIDVKVANKELSVDTSKYNYISSAYALTAYKAQGQTYDNIHIYAAVTEHNMNSFNSGYVFESRAKYDMHLYTNNESLLLEKFKNIVNKENVIDYTKLKIHEKSDDLSRNNKDVDTLVATKNDKIVLPRSMKQSDDHIKIKEAQNVKYIKKTDLPSQQQQTLKIPDHEFQELKNRTNQELKMSDPAQVLDSLGLVYKTEKNGTRYTFKIRADERTASANMYLDRAGEWKFNDFGSSQNGTVVNLVMEATHMSYKDALEYSLANLNVPNYLQQRLNELNNAKSIAKPIELNDDIKRRLNKLQDANIQRVENSNSNSKVINIEPLSEINFRAREFLQSRGISNIPKNMYEITGQYTVNKNGQEMTFTNKGIGVIGGNMKDIDIKSIDLNNLGADIHFYKPITRKDGSVMKTQSFGPKDITYIPGDSSNKVVIFESKMDYAAASKIIKDSDVIIANGTGNYRKVADLINDHKNKKIMFYNQNDTAGEAFVEKIINLTKHEKFQYIKYEKDELKHDINDLTKKGVDLDARTRNGELKDFQNKDDQIAHNMDKNISISISR